MKRYLLLHEKVNRLMIEQLRQRRFESELGPDVALAVAPWREVAAASVLNGSALFRISC